MLATTNHLSYLLQHLDITNWLATCDHLNYLRDCTVSEVSKWPDVGRRPPVKLHWLCLQQRATPLTSKLENFLSCGLMVHQAGSPQMIALIAICSRNIALIALIVRAIRAPMWAQHLS